MLRIIIALKIVISVVIIYYAAAEFSVVDNKKVKLSR